MKGNVICIICGLFVLSASQQPKVKRYRTDYEYNRKSNAFYKFHPEWLHWWRAKEVCRLEGSEIMVPSSPVDVVQAHLMFKRYPDLEYAWIGNDGQDHDAADEVPIIDLTPESGEFGTWGTKCDVVGHTGEVQSHTCYSILPFICKVEADAAYFDDQCQVYGRNYSFVSNTTSCYKLSGIACTWNEAYNECEAEGSHLVVINSEAEHQAVLHIINSNQAPENAMASWFFFAGFRADKAVNGTTRVFRTIFNQTLEEAGFSQWSENEPNNAKDNEYCGSIFKNDGKLNDLNCMSRYGFVCEKDVVPKAL